MPIYEYNCEECGEQFELLLRRADEEVRCPKCDGTSVERLLSVFTARAPIKMPSCEGSLPRCSESRCRSGSCPMSPE